MSEFTQTLACSLNRTRINYRFCNSLIMNYLGLTADDYDEKLREMGNYLWDLEQEADLASAHGQFALVEAIEAKILRQAERARAFLQVSGHHQGLAAFV